MVPEGSLLSSNEAWDEVRHRDSTGEAPTAAAVPPARPDAADAAADAGRGDRAPEEASASAPGRAATVPVAVVYDPCRRLFRVTRARGRTLASGGFGVTLSATDGKEDDGNGRDPNDDHRHDGTDAVVVDGGSHEPSTYLFIEEVVLLQRQGFLEAWDEAGRRLDAPRLCALLAPLGVAWPVYLVYAHLRQQTFRVVRHTPGRRALLEALAPHRARARRRGPGAGDSRDLLLRLRRDAALAQAPRVACPEDEELVPAFDVYRPNTRFARSNPGVPDFSVAVTSYPHCRVHLRQWLALARGLGGDDGGDGSSAAAPALKIAAVSDAGTVLLFGVTAAGVPEVQRPV